MTWPISQTVRAGQVVFLSFSRLQVHVHPYYAQITICRTGMAVWRCENPIMSLASAIAAYLSTAWCEVLLAAHLCGSFRKIWLEWHSYQVPSILLILANFQAKQPSQYRHSTTCKVLVVAVHSGGHQHMASHKSFHSISASFHWRGNSITLLLQSRVLARWEMLFSISRMSYTTASWHHR